MFVVGYVSKTAILTFFRQKNYLITLMIGLYVVAALCPVINKQHIVGISNKELWNSNRATSINKQLTSMLSTDCQFQTCNLIQTNLRVIQSSQVFTCNFFCLNILIVSELYSCSQVKYMQLLFNCSEIL